MVRLSGALRLPGSFCFRNKFVATFKMQNLSINKVKSKAANIIYGSLLALSFLSVVVASTLTPWRMVVMVVVTLVGVWSAKSYAYMVGGDLAKGLRTKFSETWGVLRENIWVLAPAIPLIGVLTLSAAGIISLETAVYLDQWIIIAFLFATGFWLRRQTNGSFIMSVVDGLIDCSIGVLIVSLKFLLK